LGREVIQFRAMNNFILVFNICESPNLHIVATVMGSCKKTTTVCALVDFSSPAESFVSRNYEVLLSSRLML